MAWYKFWEKSAPLEVEEKLNPAQRYYDNQVDPSREYTYQYERAYEDLEIVNRGVNMIVDDTAEIRTVVGEAIPNTMPVVKGVRRASVNRLLNFEPNPYQDINSFRRNLITDYLLDGNMFAYFDGVHLYHLPANKMNIHASDSTYIEKYTFNEEIDYSPREIIHVKENSFYSIYRGVSRLKPALRTMTLMRSMRSFQDNFFKNDAVPGLVIKSPNTLSDKIKERMILAWQTRYNPSGGGKRPLILDGGLEVDKIADVNFKELDFQTAIDDNENIILKALGIPPILLDSGNNANLRPNMRLYYLETILPIVVKMNSSFQRFFGFELSEDVTNIPALQPELRDQAQYYSALVNTGVLSPNEARNQLGYESIEGYDELRVPANIAGSAANPDLGGRPVDEGDKNNG